MAESQASEQQLIMVKVAQAMDTIAMHACPTCLDDEFGFGLSADTDWEAELKLVDDRILAINAAIAATAVGTVAQARAVSPEPHVQVPRAATGSPTSVTDEGRASPAKGRSSPTKPRAASGVTLGHHPRLGMTEKAQDDEQVALVRALALGRGEEPEEDD